MIALVDKVSKYETAGLMQINPQQVKTQVHRNGAPIFGRTMFSLWDPARRRRKYV